MWLWSESFSFEISTNYPTNIVSPMWVIPTQVKENAGRSYPLPVTGMISILAAFRLSLWAQFILSAHS